MKRTITAFLVAGLLVVTGVAAFAAPAGQPFHNGAIVVQGGVGFGFPQITGSTTIPPIIASVEYQMQVSPQVPLSFGGVVAYAGSKYSVSDGYGDTVTATYSDIIVGARAAYHLQHLIKVANLDPYAGIMVGYDIVNASVTASGPLASYYSSSYTPSVSTFAYGAYLGARYYFTPSIGAYVEAGYNIGYFNLGATFKF